MSKFNRAATRPAVSSPVKTESIPSGSTYEGAPGYARDAKSELFLLAVTNMVGEDTFYERAGRRDDRFRDLVDWPYAPHYRQVPAEDGSVLRIAYVDEGSGSTMLLLHGEPTWSYLYHRMIPPLVEAGFRVLAPDLIGFGIVDEVVEEAPGGAHRDPQKTAENLGAALRRHLAELKKLDPEALVADRYAKFRAMGVFEEQARTSMEGR